MGHEPEMKGNQIKTLPMSFNMSLVPPKKNIYKKIVDKEKKMTHNSFQKKMLFKNPL